MVSIFEDSLILYPEKLNLVPLGPYSWTLRIKEKFPRSFNVIHSSAGVPED